LRVSMVVLFFALPLSGAHTSVASPAFFRRTPTIVSLSFLRAEHNYTHRVATMSGTQTKAERIEEINDKIRAQLFRKGTVGLAGVATVFRQADFNGNKKLDPDEFEEALSFAGLFLSAADLHLLFSEYDRDGDGNIGYEEFIKGLAPDLSGARLDKVKEAFAKIDKDGACRISCVTGIPAALCWHRRQERVTVTEASSLRGCRYSRAGCDARGHGLR
jgi:hypothetical protein